MSEVRLTPEIDQRAMHILSRAVQELGGGAEMVRRHEQTILPALVESAFALVLADEHKHSPEEIARFLGVGPGAVQSMLGAPADMISARLRYRTDPMAEFDPHSDPAWSDAPLTANLEPEYVAGALARFAYEIVIREMH